MDVLKLREVRPSSGRLPRAMCLILQNVRWTSTSGQDYCADVRRQEEPSRRPHVFPRAYLNKRDCPAKLRDCILNRTYIDRTTNRRLSKRAPSDYFGEIRDKQG